MEDKILNDGDPINFEERKCAFLTCCECGLTHLLMLGEEGVVNKKFVLYVYRDDNLTEESRKEIKAKKTKEEEQNSMPDPEAAVEEEKEEMDAQEVIDKADKAIENAEEVMGDRKCSVCGVRTILARNKTGICTPCQLEPKKGPRKHKDRKAKF